jgi:pyruvate kinase
MRKTKIIATLGPATNSVEIIKNLINAGLNGARINFSHGSHESHLVIINMLKQARQEMGANVPLVLDTKGPEIRTKSLKDNSIFLQQGDTFTLTSEDTVGTIERVSVTYKDFAKDLSVGKIILIDDGLIELKVKDIKNNDVICEIINSGNLGENKGVNLPSVKVNLPALTEKDISDIKFGIEQGFDFIAASFIRSAEDVMSIRKVLKENNGEHIKIICKIENREGVDNIDEILKITDGIMVARGDMGVEIPPEEVPVVQKNIIRKCIHSGKLVVTATQMLESMIVNPRPTRAEASDVANAIYDGTDVVMLSGETAKGDYPIEAVKMMSRIAETAEASINYDTQLISHNDKDVKSTTNAICYAACVVSAEIEAKCIVSITKSGFSTNNISKIRPLTPIVAITPDEVVKRQLQLTWGCVPLLSKTGADADTTSKIESAVTLATDAGFAKKGDNVTIVAGLPVGKVVSTNTIRVHKIGEPIK